MLFKSVNKGSFKMCFVLVHIHQYLFSILLYSVCRVHGIPELHYSTNIDRGIRVRMCILCCCCNNTIADVFVLGIQSCNVIPH